VVDPRAVDVARRAAEIGCASNVELADDLALWRLAGGRPEVDAVAGRPEELGLVLEASTSASMRRSDGAHYTPEPLARSLVARALAGHRRPIVCDPACGGGALLLAAGRHLVEHGEDPADVVHRLRGADIDPLAVATTEVALTLWAGVAPPRSHLRVADTLLDGLEWVDVDVVVGNPPFLSQLGASTTRTLADAARLRDRFGTAVQAYTDSAGLFLLVGCEMARRGGTVAMVLPQSVLGVRDASGVRARVGELASVREVWVPPPRSFDAAVDVCVPVLDVGAGASADAEPRWSAHLARAFGVPSVDLGTAGTVGDEATTGAAFRATYPPVSRCSPPGSSTWPTWRGGSARPGLRAIASPPRS